jgi:hypothetical protein
VNKRFTNKVALEAFLIQSALDKYGTSIRDNSRANKIAFGAVEELICGECGRRLKMCRPTYDSARGGQLDPITLYECKWCGKTYESLD